MPSLSNAQFSRARGRGFPSKRQYVNQQKQKRAEAKSRSAEDIGQNYKIAKLEKTVKKLSASDMGYFIAQTTAFDPVLTLEGVNSGTALTAFIVQLPMAPGAGDGENDRQGAFANLRKMFVDYVVRVDETQNPNNGTTLSVRVMLICISKPNGTPSEINGSLMIQWDDLFATAVASETMSRQNMYMHYNPHNRSLYKVYYDRTHVLSNIITTANADNADSKRFAKGHINVSPTRKNSRVSFNSNGASPGITDIETNAWVLLAFSDNQTAMDANPPEISARSLSIFSQ